MRTTSALIFSTMSLVCLDARAAPHETARWTARVTREFTLLGDPSSDGFGTTGGLTLRGGVERVVLRPSEWASLALTLDARCFGFDLDGPRTVGAEGDAGAALAGSFAVPILGLKGSIGAGASAGAYRNPLATAVRLDGTNRLRFVGWRPAAEIFLSIAHPSGGAVRLSAAGRYYSTPVWSGFAWNIGAGGSWSW